LKAILYVAGRGSRLGPAHADSHKVLLRFGDKTLLGWHAEHLVSVGASELVVVTGHAERLVEAEIAELRERSELAKLTIRTIHNPDWLEGSILSLAVSLPEIEPGDDGTWLMDGDVLYPADMLRRLRLSPHPTALLIDTAYSTADDDPVLVAVVDGRPVDFRKKWTGTADLVGESVGFFKIGHDDVDALIGHTRRRLAAGRRADSYDDVLRDLVLESRFGFEDVTGIPWTEIDFPADLVKARREILPAILRTVAIADGS